MEQSNGISLHLRLTLRYSVALGLVALLSLASYGLMQHSVATEVLGAKLLNVAGRQRMLCQRVETLSLRALRAAEAERPARLAELRLAVQQFALGHDALVHGPAENLGVAAGNPALTVLRRDTEAREALTHDFIGEAEALLDAALAQSPDEGAVLARTLRLGQKADILLAALDLKMDELQRLGEDTLARLNRLIMLLSGAALAGLLFTGLMIFRPMVAGVVRNREHLERLNHILETQAGTDKLTGAYNRRAWDLEIAREFAKTQRQGGRLCMVMADLDHFKNVNDTHGHQRGDRVLQEFTARLMQAVRLSDSVYRIGGEEFALLLPGTDIEQGRVTAEKLRECVAESPLDGDLPITASFGVAVTDGQESPDELFRRADSALYAAKAGGRNRVESSVKSC